MYQFFDRNTVFTYVAMPVLLVLLRLRLILHPMDGYIAMTSGEAGQFSPLYQMVFGGVADGSVLSIVLSIFVTLLASFIVSAISNRFHFMDKQSGLPAALFIILSSGFVMAQGLHPVQIFLVMLLWALHLLFAGSDSDKPMSHVFAGALFFSVGCLFYAKGLYFVSFIVISMIGLRMFSLRCILAMMMGLLVPILMFAAACFYFDTFLLMANEWWQNVISPVVSYHAGKYSWTYLAILVVFTVMSILSAIGEMQKLSIIESRLMRIILWLIIIGMISLALKQFSFEILHVLSGGVAILMAPWFHRMRSFFWQEGIMWVMLAATVFIQWKIQGMTIVA